MANEGSDFNSLLNYLLFSSQQFAPDTVLNEFKRLKTDHERVDLAYKYVSLSPVIHSIILPPRVGKSDTKSQTLRERGNAMFRNRKQMEALQLYTESIAFAESGSSFLGLAYANRSAVLFEQGYYKECLEDINRAFNNNYPNHLRNKLLTRQVRAQFEKESKPIRFYTSLPVISMKHLHISAAADCLELEENDQYGMHIVTTRDVKAGEVLSVEKPFVLEVLSQSKFLHCHECLELCLDLIPCPRCATALYCSTACRTTAFTFYHRYECDFGCTVENKPLALKFTLLCAMEYMYKERNSISDDDGMYRSDRFKELYTLETNEKMFNVNYVFMFSAVAGIIFQNLKSRTKFIEENSLDENKLKDMIFRNVLIETSNSMEIEKVKYAKGFVGTDTTIIGRGIYSFTSRFNHSCNPNCFRISYGSSFVVRALQGIKKGQQCTFAYGCTYYRTSFTDRQAFLKNFFFFTCRCVACENSWPIYDSLHMGKDFREALDQLPPRAGNARATWYAKEVCRMAVAFSEDATKVKEDEILTKCYRLQTLLPEPSKAMVHVRNIIHHLFHIRGNQDVTL